MFAQTLLKLKKLNVIEKWETQIKFKHGKIAWHLSEIDKGVFLNFSVMSQENKIHD